MQVARSWGEEQGFQKIAWFDGCKVEVLDVAAIG